MATRKCSMATYKCGVVNFVKKISNIIQQSTDIKNIIVQWHQHLLKLLNVGDVIIMRGGTCHAGAHYQMLNIRLHYYIDPRERGAGIAPRNENTTYFDDRSTAGYEVVDFFSVCGEEVVKTHKPHRIVEARRKSLETARETKRGMCEMMSIVRACKKKRC